MLLSLFVHIPFILCRACSLDRICLPFALKLLQLLDAWSFLSKSEWVLCPIGSRHWWMTEFQRTILLYDFFVLLSPCSTRFVYQSGLALIIASYCWIFPIAYFIKDNFLRWRFVLVLYLSVLWLNIPFYNRCSFDLTDLKRIKVCFLLLHMS